MDGKSTLSTVLDALVAFGTVSVAVLAIWGDWFRAKLAPPKLELELLSDVGTPTTLGQVKAIYYHLRVVNHRHWQPGQDCRVLLRSIARRGPDGRFYPIPLPVPLQFIWAPAEFNTPTTTLVKEQMVDFGVVREDQKRFIPNFYTTPSSFSGYVGPNEAVRFLVEIEAKNFSSKPQSFEVAWDGIWSFEAVEMSRHLRLRKIEP